MNSNLSHLPDKPPNTFCTRRRGGFAGAFWDALAKRRRRKGRRGSQSSRRCPTREILFVEMAGKLSGGGGVGGAGGEA